MGNHTTRHDECMFTKSCIISTTSGKIFEPTTFPPSTEKPIEVTTISATTEKNGEFTTISPTPEHTTEGSNSSASKHQSSVWNEATIVIAVIGGILVILGVIILGVVLYFLVSRKKKNAVLTENEVRSFLSGDSNTYGTGDRTVMETTMGSAYDQSLEIPKEKLKIDNNKVLGSGAFGLVLRAWIESPDGQNVQVALKVARNNCHSTVLKDLLTEIKVMTYVGKHANIVILKGAYTAELAQGIIYIATELCALGSLEGYLRKSVDRPHASSDCLHEMELTPVSSITLSDMVRWSYEIACGMEYLEKKYVVHADLATRNVLLTSEKTAKISDFGLSRRMYNYTNYVKKQAEPLPWRWMAIEALEKLEFSAKSDVWSYGVTLWEIFSKGKTPYPGLSWTQTFVSKLVNGLRPDCPPHATPEIYNFMRDCWNFDPKERPSFTELITFTEVALQKCATTYATENAYK